MRKRARSLKRIRRLAEAPLAGFPAEEVFLEPLTQVIELGRNPLERLVQRIPGFRGYYGRENRRQADRELRSFAASRVERLIAELQVRIKEAALDGIDPLRELVRGCETLAHELRHADAGYSGFFSEIKWDSEQILDAVYRQDEQIVESVVALLTSVCEDNWTAEDLGRELRSLRRAVEDRRARILGLVEGE